MWQTNWACNLLSSKSKECSELSFSSAASHIFTPAHQVASGLVYNTQESSQSGRIWRQPKLNRLRPSALGGIIATVRNSGINVLWLAIRSKYVKMMSTKFNEELCELNR